MSARLHSLVANAERVGAALADELSQVPGIAGVRGAGLLVAAELEQGDAGGLAARLLRDHHVIVNAVSPTAIRLCPPLCLTAEQARAGVAAIRSALTA